MKRSQPMSYIAALVGLLICGSLAAEATEVQLAGIRLGQHAINVLDVYGNPDGVVVGSGEEITSAQTPPGGAAMMGAPGAMGAPGEMPGAAPPGAEMMGPGGMPGSMAPGGGPEGMMPGMPAAEAGAGMPGMPGAPGGGAGPGGVSVAPFPRWALPVWVTMREGEVEWIYRRSAVVLGFVLDEFGYVVVIAVAGEQCNYARTALWRPHEFIQLGDSFKRVVYRYGWPDDTITFDATGGEVATPFSGPVSVTFNSNTRAYSRDVILRYTERNNVAFTFHDMKVTRIHIWSRL